MVVFALLLVLFGTSTDGWASVLFLIEAGLTAVLATGAFVEAVIVTERDYRGQRVQQTRDREGRDADAARGNRPIPLREGSAG
jgi:hypothetical protein